MSILGSRFRFLYTAVLVAHIIELVGILLAAGSTRRFGSHKLLVELPDGEPIALRAARNLVQVLPDSLAVIRPGDKELAERLAVTGIGLIENPHAVTGIAGSIQAGILARADADSWLIALADMPWIRPVTMLDCRRLARRCRYGSTHLRQPALAAHVLVRRSRCPPAAGSCRPRPAPGGDLR